jgi:hypothetical protein
MRFRFIATERASFPVRALCRVVGVSASGFYAWLRRGSEDRARDDDNLARRIAAIFAASRRTYGSPRVHAELRAQGVRVGRKRVERLMRAAGLAVPITRRRVPRTTDSRHGLPVAPNLLGRRFAADRPNAVWLADISYIPAGEGWLYLAAVRDMATREIVGWSMADHLRADLACDALLMAIRRRQPPRGLLHHSDRGVQGGFKRSSQRLDGGGCDEQAETAIGSVWTQALAVAGPAAGCGARGAKAVLGGDSGRGVERRCCSFGRRPPGGRRAMVPKGRWHAASDVHAVGQATVRPSSFIRGARGDRSHAGTGPLDAGGGSSARTRSVDDLS